MSTTTLFALSALVALMPAAVLPFCVERRRDPLFWMLLAVALAGTLVWVFVQFTPGWRTGLAPALWATIAATLAVFMVLAATASDSWRLESLLLPYLVMMGLAATVWQDQPDQALVVTAPAAWVQLHIASSLLTYGILTIAAVAGLAAFLRERALKSKMPSRLTERLPPLAVAEQLELRLLAVCAVVMAVGLLTGMAVQNFATGTLLEFDHKTLFSLLTFVVITLLLFARYRSGLRGRRAARLVLLAYLLLTIAYPGVKFVTDVLMA
jgi:ABC-type uncharacterized transport system permease subunit